MLMQRKTSTTINGGDENPKVRFVCDCFQLLVLWEVVRLLLASRSSLVRPLRG